MRYAKQTVLNWYETNDTAALQLLPWRSQVLLVTEYTINGETHRSISTGFYVRTPCAPFKPCFQCECGWFEPARFRYFALLVAPNRSI